MEQKLKSISRFLSRVLRHRPETIHLNLDEQGWAEISQLLELARRSGKSLNLELLKTVVRENDKQRFSISHDGSRIRANQGHSIDVDLELSLIQPPSELFHGTVQRFIDNIRRQGLLPMNRNHVHLSADIETARVVGQRRGAPVVLKIDAAAMYQSEFRFYKSENGVWLTDSVPTVYISF